MSRGKTRGYPALIAGDSQIKRMTSGNTVDLVNEIDGLIVSVKDADPTVSNNAITDTLIAAYCPVVAQITNISADEKWHLMRRFDRVLVQQISANTMSPDTLIIAKVPLPPAVYHQLSDRARARGQRTTDLMAAILTKAAGQ